MLSFLVFVVFALIISSVGAFMPVKQGRVPVSTSMKMLSMEKFFSLPLAELYANPTARYNGELIDQSLKLVEKVSKPAGYEYGAVSQDGVPVLASALVLVVALAAAVPYFLAIGETAQAQQREREASDKTVNNQFVNKGKKDVTGVKAGKARDARK